MAAKRPTKKPVVKADVIRRNGRQEPVRRAPDVAQDIIQSAVEARAVREEAVHVDVAAASMPDTADWAPAPVQMTWFERIFGRWRRDGEKNGQVAEQMAVVKASVLHELETLGVKKGVAVKGSPFSTVMLPVAPKRKRWTWWLVGAVAVVLVLIMVMVGRRPDAPEAVMGQALQAVRSHDVSTFEKKVDVASVASSIVNQMMNVGPQDDMTAKMASFVKPGLADALKDEILAAVNGDKLDDSGNTLLGKLWHAMGAGRVRVGNARVAQQDDTMAVAEVPLQRPDLGLTLPLQVVLNKTADDAWQIVDMPNLAAVMGSVAEAERVLEARRMEVAQAAAANTLPEVKVESVKKTKDTSAHGSNLIVSMVLANEGVVAARDVQLEVAFGDAAGQPMMTTRLTLDGELAPGARREQVWSVPVDRKRAMERYVADLPLTALTVTATVVR